MTTKLSPDQLNTVKGHLVQDVQEHRGLTSQLDGVKDEYATAIAGMFGNSLQNVLEPALRSCANLGVQLDDIANNIGASAAQMAAARDDVSQQMNKFQSMLESNRAS